MLVINKMKVYKVSTKRLNKIYRLAYHIQNKV